MTLSELYTELLVCFQSTFGLECTFAFITRIVTLSLFGWHNTVLMSLCNFLEQSCILGSFERKRYDEVLGVEIISMLRLEEALVIILNLSL